MEHDYLPDYRVALEGEMVNFRNRISFLPKAEVRYLVLDPEAYLHAKQVAPGYDVYFLEQEWRKLVGGKWHAGTWLPRQSIRRNMRAALSAQSESIVCSIA